MKIIEVEAETLKLGYILNIIPYNYYVLLYTGTGNIFKTGFHPGCPVLTDFLPSAEIMSVIRSQ